LNSVATVTLVIASFLVLIALVQPAAERLRLPYTVLLAFVGIAVGGTASFLLHSPLMTLFDDLVSPIVNLPVSASIFLVVFLPPLLFHAALTIDVREIAQDAAPILTLAILAVFAAAGAIGISLSCAGVPLMVALLLGAIVATTDPAAVVAIFRDVGAPPRLNRLLEGEALLNDAAAIVLFGFLVDVIAGGGHPGIGEMLGRFVEEFLGGVLLGFVAGRVFGAALPYLRGSRAAEVTLSIGLPYIVYLLGDEVFAVSGVVGVAAAGLTAGAVGRVRLTPDNWEYLEKTWEQTGFWAGSLIFLIASTLVPKLLSTTEPHDVLLLLIVVAAALLSRAAVLFGVLPVLRALRLSQHISAPYKLAITWGGLRGAVTLALALAVTENNLIDPETKNFVAVLATGFTLFTLLVNGLTLNPVIRLLGLNRLSPLNQAVRDKVLALSLSDVRDAVFRTAIESRIPSAAAQSAAAFYERRIGELDGLPTLQGAVSQDDRIRIGLVALTNRERRLLLDHHAQHTVSGTAIERLLHNTTLILDGARTEGLSGYTRAAAALLGFTRGFRIAHMLHRRFGIAGPLQRDVSIRFEMLLTRRLTLDALALFARERLPALLGIEVATSLQEVVAERARATARALDALRLQYPDHAEALETRFLEQSGLRQLLVRYQDLFEEGLINGEVLHNLEGEYGPALSAARLPPLDLGLKTDELIAKFSLFAGLAPNELKALIRLFRPRLLVPDEVVIRKGERGRGMYFLSSGAVEVILPNERVRLGSGEFFGEMALLDNRPRAADVVSMGYGVVLVLGAADFQNFLSLYPHVKAEIETTAKARGRVSERVEA
jgi:CPA1 family monovalent cation:H+ antiporter